MRKYCKAYHLGDLRQFRGWKETRAENSQERSDDTIVYLWDDFTVVSSPIHKESVLFEDVTPEWQKFCTQILKFEIPEDLRYAYAEQQSGDSAEPAAQP
jgi:hypothetical protein